MSADFQKVLVIDDRLAVKDSIKYAVMKGAQNMTVSEFNAISQSPSSIVFNVQVPSEQTLIDRRVMWESTITIRVQGVPALGEHLINWGSKDALAPFPLHQLTTTQTATINNNTVSQNTRDVLASLLRFHDKRELSRYNGSTPTAYDTYQKYTDALNATNNVLGSYLNGSLDNDFIPRGAYGASIVGNTVGDGSTTKTVDITFTVREPILMSPFLWANPSSNAMGIYGIQNLNFQFNLGSASRAIRHAGVAFTSVALQNVADSKLIFNFLSPHPSLPMPSRNVIPYYELPRYITTVSQSIPNATRATLTTNTLQLNQVPDKLILCVRKVLGNQTPSDADCFLPIKGVSLNFNNNSGILSSATPQDLWRYSTENGVNQSWLEFYGYANVQNGVSVNGLNVPLSGSLLVLAFGKDIQLTEEFYASGSLGNFNLQMNVQVENNTGALINANEYEICMITMNSGLMVNERGTTQVYTGLLTKQDVLDTDKQEPYTRSDVARMVGGGFFDTLKSIAGAILPKLPSLAKTVLSGVQHPLAQGVSGALGQMGYGKGKLASRLM